MNTTNIMTRIYCFPSATDFQRLYYKHLDQNKDLANGTYPLIKEWIVGKCFNETQYPGLTDIAASLSVFAYTECICKSTSANSNESCTNIMNEKLNNTILVTKALDKLKFTK